jgi:predicted dehydrogenase
MRESLKVAIVGYGLAGRVFHRPLIEACPGLNITAVVTANPERREQALVDTPGVFVAGDLDQLFAHDSYDIVVVAAANAIHVSASMAAIGNGAHVVVDKPIAADANQARDLFTFAAGHNRNVHVFHNRRWDSDFLTLRDLVSSGELGNIYRFESAIDRFRPELKGTWRESGSADNLPGMLYDLGSHLVDQALVLFGPACRVYADARAMRIGATSDDITFMNIEHASGVHSQLSANSVSAIAAPRFKVMGLAGAAQIDGFDTQEQTLRTGSIPTSAEWSPEARDFSVTTVAGTQSMHLKHGRWDSYYPAVRDSILHGTPEPVSTESALDTMRTLDALRASVRSGEWESL